MEYRQRPRNLTRASILLALIAGTSLAQESSETIAARAAKTTVPKNIPDALEKIASPLFAQRESAMDYLLKQPAEVRSQVEARLEKETDPEAATRLSRVALHLYMKSITVFEGKASVLGIALNLDVIDLGRDERQTAITVMELQPGFPSAELLKAGDRLIAINGDVFPAAYSIDEFRLFINGKKPGAKLTFTLFRGKEQLKIEVPLAGVKDEGVMNLTEYMALRAKAAADYLLALKVNRDAGIVIPGVSAPPTFDRTPTLR